MATAATVQLTSPSARLLSTNDSAVLSALFDPESSPSSGISILEDALSLSQISPALLPTLQSQEAAAIRPLSSPSPSVAAIEAAIADISALITRHPEYAPAYLNRAQAIRLELSAKNLQTDGKLFQPSNISSTSTLFSDLTIVISLTMPASPSSPVSRFQADLLSKAHTHRGYLLLQAAKASRDSLPPELQELDTEQMEEMASRDFFMGGRYGNRIAKQLSVQTNPYAKACGAIVKEALKKEREEYEASKE